MSGREVLPLTPPPRGADWLRRAEALLPLAGSHVGPAAAWFASRTGEAEGAGPGSGPAGPPPVTGGPLRYVLCQVVAEEPRGRSCIEERAVGSAVKDAIARAYGDYGLACCSLAFTGGGRRDPGGRGRDPREEGGAPEGKGNTPKTRGDPREGREGSPREGTGTLGKKGGAPGGESLGERPPGKKAPPPGRGTP